MKAGRRIAGDPRDRANRHRRLNKRQGSASELLIAVLHNTRGAVGAPARPVADDLIATLLAAVGFAQAT